MQLPFKFYLTLFLVDSIETSVNPLRNTITGFLLSAWVTLDFLYLSLHLGTLLFHKKVIFVLSFAFDLHTLHVLSRQTKNPMFFLFQTVPSLFLSPKNSTGLPFSLANFARLPLKPLSGTM